MRKGGRSRTRGLPGWDEVSVDDPILRELAEAAERRPAGLVSLAGRALLMSPELLAVSVRHDSTTAAKGVLRAACERLPTPIRAALTRISVLPGPFDLDDIDHAIQGTGVQSLPAVRHLVEAGLVEAIEDPVLAQVRFVVSRSVRELCAPQVTQELTREVLLAYTLAVARRAADWVAKLDTAGPESRAPALHRAGELDPRARDVLAPDPPRRGLPGVSRR